MEKTEPVIGDFVNGIYISNGLLFKAQRLSRSMIEETKVIEVLSSADALII